MSDSSEDKQFDATPSRVAKAKREGNLPRATEFGANAAFVAAFLASLAAIPEIGAAARLAIAHASAGDASPGPELAIVAWSLVPMIAAAAAGACACIVQNGGLQSVAIALKVERLQPLAGLKRMLSRETLTHALRAVVAFSISCAAIAPTLSDVTTATATGRGPMALAATAWSGAQRAIVAAAAVGTAFALAEYGAARQSWLRKLRMSFDELRREAKENDGDPQARARRKSFHRNLIRGSLSQVRDASFVIANPTHVAIALEYRPPEVPVPRVLVRAVDGMAMRVRALAEEHRIPVIENRPLARALYRDAQAGAAIPATQYVAVAEVVAALIRAGALG